MIHRDLKPANILLERSAAPDLKHDPRDPRPEPRSAADLESRISDFSPKITDFGLAKFISAEDGTVQTHTGAVLGTPGYMAPEQTSRRDQEVGPAADVYALGTILYELVVGRPPFSGETALDTLEMVRSQLPVPPRRLVPKLCRDVETICLKCLEKDPSRRYPSAGDLGEDLRRFVNGEPIVARPVGRFETAGRWCRRNPWAAAFLAAMVAGAVGLVAMASIQARTNARLSDANARTSHALAKAQMAQDAIQAALAQSEDSRQEADWSRKQADHSRKQAEAVSTFLVEASAARTRRRMAGR